MSGTVGEASSTYGIGLPQQALPPSPFELEEAARARVEKMRAEAASAAVTARQAFRASADARRNAAWASSTVRTQRAALQDDGLSPDARAALEAELSAAEAESAELDTASGKADSLANRWQEWALYTEDRQLDAEQEANFLFKQHGKAEPFPAAKPIHDGFLQLTAIRLKELAKLLGTGPSVLPGEAAAQGARRLALAVEVGPANGAKVLEQQLRENEDPAFRRTLASDIWPQASKLGEDLAKLGGGAKPNDATGAQQAVEALSRVAELLGATGAWPLAWGFAEGVKKLDAATPFAQLFAAGLVDGPNGGTFAVELAAALHSAGKAAAAQEVLSGLLAAMKAVRAEFLRAAGTAEALDAALAQHLRGFAQGMSPGELERQLELFREEHYDAYLAHQRATRQLASMLSGAGLALAFSKSSGLPQGETTGGVLHQALMLLGEVSRLVQSEAGQLLLGEALEAQHKGERAFLDSLPDALLVLSSLAEQRPELLAQAQLPPERFLGGGAAFLQMLGVVTAQVLAPQVVALRSAERSSEALDVLRAAVRCNPGLFGLNPKEALQVCGAFGDIVAARNRLELRVALRAFRNLPRSPGGLALQSLAVVLAISNLQRSLPAEAQQILEALQATVPELRLGTMGLMILGAALRKPTLGPGLSRMLGQRKPGTTAGAGGATGKIASALCAFIRALSSGRPPAALDGDRGAEPLMGVGSLLSGVTAPQLVETIVGAVARSQPRSGTALASGAL